MICANTDSRCFRQGGWLGTLFTLALLAACGGGGGGGGADPPPAASPPSAPALTVTPSSTQAQGGGTDVTLTATVQGASGAVAWALEGPGTLSAGSGGTVRYSPPPSSEVRVPWEATVVASSGELVQRTVLQLQPAPGAPAAVPGTQWEVVRAPKAGYTDLRLLNGRFFAVTEAGDIYNSVEGITWVPRATPSSAALQAIAFGNGGYLAVGPEVTLRSADGDRWQLAGGVPGRELFDMAAGNGVFVAIGIGGLLLSSDGAAWQAVGPSDIVRGQGVAFGAGRFVALDGAGRIHSSVDGRNWSTTTLPAVSTASAVAFGNGQFLVLAADQNFASSDGFNWTPVARGDSAGFRLRFAGERFFAIDWSAAWESTDGRSWTRMLGVGGPGPSLVGVAFNGGRYVVAGNGGGLQHRGRVSLPLSDAWSGSTWSMSAAIAVAGAFHVFDEAGLVMRSDDGLNWTTMPQVLGAQFSDVAFGNGIFVAVSRGGWHAIWRSADAVSWTGVSLPDFGVRLSSVAFGNGRFVAGAPTGEIYTSDDGTTWTAAASPVRVQVAGMTFGNGRFVGVSVQGAIFTSVDGRTWSTAVTEAGWLNDVAHGDAGFVAVGGISRGVIWTSRDGLDWVPQTAAATMPALHVATYGNGQYLLAGQDGAIFIGSDGERWQARSAAVHPTYRAAAAANGRFVVVGNGGSIVVSAQ